MDNQHRRAMRCRCPMSAAILAALSLATAAVGARARGLSGKADPHHRAGARRAGRRDGARRGRRIRRRSASRSSSRTVPAAISRSALLLSSHRRRTATRCCSGSTGRSRSTRASNTKSPYNPFTDLAPISGLAKADQVVIAIPRCRRRTSAESLALAKQKPGDITFAAFGLGSTTHLYMEMLQSMAGVKFEAVQYKGRPRWSPTWWPVMST